MTLVREPDAGNPPVRFDEREVETEHGMRLVRPERGNPETELCRSLPHRATSRLYQHLAALRQEKIVDYHEQGKLRCYYLARPGLAKSLLRFIGSDYPVLGPSQEAVRRARRPAAQHGERQS